MAKKDKQTDAPSVQRDDALFETLGKNKKRKRRKIIITVVSIVLVLAIIAVTGVGFLQRRVREQLHPIREKCFPMKYLPVLSALWFPVPAA